MNMSIPSIYNLRKRDTETVTDQSPVKRRQILGVDKTASVTQPVTFVSAEVSAMRVDRMVTDCLVDATVSQTLNLKLERARTNAQGASAHNSDTTPSRKVHGRHLSAISRVKAKPLDPEEISSHIEKAGTVTPTTDRTLRALDIPTPVRNALNQSPQRSKDILAPLLKRAIDLYKGTHIGLQKNATVNSLATSNQFDRMVEFRIRPFWDRLMSRFLEEGTSPKELTVIFVDKLRTILDSLKNKADSLPTKVDRFLELEQLIDAMDKIGPFDQQTYINTLAELLSLKKSIVSEFSTIEILNSVRFRRNDWYWIEKIVKENDLETYKESLQKPSQDEAAKIRIQKVAADVQLEATFQQAAVQKIDELVIENMQALLFNESTQETVLQLFDPLT